MLAEDEKCQQSEGTYVSFYGLRGGNTKGDLRVLCIICHMKSVFTKVH